MTLAPKTRFLQQKEAARLVADFMASEHFQRACEVALAQMVLDKPSAKNHEEGVVFNAALEGAREFIRTLLSISTPPPKPPERPVTNLNRTV